MFILRLSSSFTEVISLCMQWVKDSLVFHFFRSLLFLRLLSVSSNLRADVSVCSCVGQVTFRSSTQCSGVGLQSLIQWTPKFVSLWVIVWAPKSVSLFPSECSQSLLLNVHCFSFIGPTLGTKVCHLLYLTQQPVTNWVIYTRLALGGQETCTISGGDSGVHGCSFVHWTYKGGRSCRLSRWVGWSDVGVGSSHELQYLRSPEEYKHST